MINSCHLLIGHRSSCRIAFEVSEHALSVYALGPLASFPTIQETLHKTIHHLFTKCMAEPLFFRKMAPGDLIDGKLFGAAPILSEDGLRLFPLPMNATEGYLFKFTFSLDYLPKWTSDIFVKKVQDGWIASNAKYCCDNPFPKPLPRPTGFISESTPASDYTMSPRLSALIGKIPFTLSIEKIAYCLDAIISPYMGESLPYQSQEFTYQTYSPKAAGAASASSTGDSISGLKRSSHALLDNPLKDASVAVLTEEDLAKQKLHYITRHLAKALFESYRSSFDNSVLDISISQARAIFTQNIPNIARGILHSVFTSKNINETSLLRTQMFLNLLSGRVPLVNLVYLSQAIEEAITDLADDQKAWLRAKFVSIAFVAFMPPPFSYRDLSYTIRFPRFPQTSLIDRKSLDAELTSLEKAHQNLLNSLDRMQKTLPFSHMIAYQQGVTWTRRRHLIAYRDRIFSSKEAGAASASSDDKSTQDRACKKPKIEE